MRTWESIIERLEEFEQHPSPSREYLRNHSSVMLELIPTIREKSNQFHLEPFLSHGQLCLSLAEKSQIIGFYADSSDKIKVELFTKEKREPFESFVMDKSEIASEIELLLRKIDTV